MYLELINSTILLIWLGTVIVVNFVFIPSLAKLTDDNKAKVIGAIFPRLFRFATVLVLLFITTLLLRLANGHETNTLATVLISTLSIFHLAVEPKFRRLAMDLSRSNYSQENLKVFAKYINFIPRIGLGIISFSSVLFFFV